MKYSLFIITIFMYSVSVAADDLPVEPSKERFISSLYNPHNKKECAATMLRANLALASKQCFDDLMAGYHLSDLAIYTAWVNLAQQCITKLGETSYYNNQCSSYPLQSVEVAARPGSVVVLKIGSNQIAGDKPLKEFDNQEGWIYALETVDQYQHLSNKQESSLYTMVLRDGNLDTRRAVTYKQNSTRYDDERGLVFSVLIDNASEQDLFIGMPVYSTRCSDAQKTLFLQGVIIDVELNNIGRGARLIVQSQAEYNVLTAIERIIKQDQAEHVLFVNLEHKNSNATSAMSEGSLSLPFKSNNTAIEHLQEHAGSHLLSYLNSTTELVPNQNNSYVFPAAQRVALMAPERRMRMILQQRAQQILQDDRFQEFIDLFRQEHSSFYKTRFFFFPVEGANETITIAPLRLTFNGKEIVLGFPPNMFLNTGWNFLLGLAEEPSVVEVPAVNRFPVMTAINEQQIEGEYIAAFTLRLAVGQPLLVNRIVAYNYTEVYFNRRFRSFIDGYRERIHQSLVYQRLIRVLDTLALTYALIFEQEPGSEARIGYVGNYIELGNQFRTVMERYFDEVNELDYLRRLNVVMPDGNRVTVTHRFGIGWNIGRNDFLRGLQRPLPGEEAFRAELPDLDPQPDPDPDPQPAPPSTGERIFCCGAGAACTIQ